MGTNYGPYSIDENTSARGQYMLRTALGLTPLAMAAVAAAQGISIEGGVVNPLASGKAFRGLGGAIGDAARRHRNREVESAQALRTRLETVLKDAGAIKELSNSLESHTALMHTLSVALDDPAFGLDTTAVQSLKSQIAEAMNNSPSGGSDDLVQRIVGSLLETSGPEGMTKWKQYMGDFSKVAGQIEVPNFEVVPSGVSFNPLEVGTLKGKAKKRYRRLQKQFGNEFDVRLGQYEEFGKTNIVAQIWRKGGSGDRWKANVPIDLAKPGEGMGTFWRSGETFNTLYMAPRGYMDAVALHRLEQQHGEDVFSKRKKLQSAIVDPFNYAMDLLTKHRTDSGEVNWKEFNAALRSPMMVMPRGASENKALEKDHPINIHAKHIRSQIGRQMNVMGLMGIHRLPASERAAFVARASAGGLFDFAGQDRALSGFGMDQSASLGVYQGSPIDILNRTFGLIGPGGQRKGITRADSVMPITLRERQLVGRTSVFSDPLRQAKHVALGGVIHDPGRFGEMGKLMGGGLSQAVVVDFRAQGAIQKRVAGTGMGFIGRRVATNKPIDLTILNPKQYQIGSSNILNRLMKEGTVTLTGEELAQMNYLGQHNGMAKMLPRDPQATALTLAIDRGAQAAGKDMIHVKAFMGRSQEYFKVFGLSHKGNLRTVGMEDVEEFLTPELQGAFGRYGVSAEDVAWVGSDFFSKGEIAMLNQISGSARIMSGVQVEDIVAKASGMGPDMLGGSMRGKYAAAATDLMLARGASGSDIGMMLAGVWHGAEGKRTKKGGFGLDRRQIVKFLKGRMSRDDTMAAIRSMRAGLTVMHDIYQQGEGTGDWARALAGVEPRFAKTMHERLLSLGLSNNDASKMVANLYESKIGFSRQFELTSRMMDMASSLTGARGPGSLLHEEGAARMTYGQLIEKLPDAPERQRSKFIGLLHQMDQGMVLDFSDAPTALRRAAKKVFGQGEIYIPGGEMFRLSAGTDIRMSGGESLDIAGEFGQMIKSLETRLLSLNSDQEEAARILSEWKEQGVSLFANLRGKLLSGKLRSGISSRAAVYDISYGAGGGLRGKRYKRVKELFKKTSGTAAFMNAQGFATMLADQGGDAAFNAKQAERFFLGMERSNVGKPKGIFSISMRHPTMTSGNVFATQLFRDVSEVTALGAEDAFFKKMAAAQWNYRGGQTGAQVMQDIFGREISSFADIASVKDAKKRHTFFKSFVGNLENFMGGAGGGIISFPRLQTSSGDIGLAPQAFADMDGDTIITMMLGKGKAEMYSKMFSTGNAAADIHFRTFAGQLSSQVKSGMETYAKGLPTTMSEAAEQARKEMALTLETGRLDVSLRPLHDAIMNYGGEGLHQRQVRAMLGVLQENVILKAKKLPAYTTLPQELAAAATRLSETGNIDAFRDIVVNKIFQGTDLGGGGSIAAGAMKAVDSSSADIVQAMGGALEGHEFTLQKALDTIHQTMAQQRVGGGGTMTERQLEAAFKTSHEGMVAMDAIYSAMDMTDSAMKNYRGANAISDAMGDVSNMMKSIGNTMANLDRRATAPLAIGLLGSSLLMGAVGDRGYAADPIVMPGESISPDVGKAVATGNLLGAPVGPSGDQLAGRADAYAMMSRPINQGTMYASAPNAYQIRGEISSPHGLGSLSGYLHRVTGGLAGGSIMINDTRRPITGAYVDRLMGEY